MIRLLVSDIDGTLVRTDKSLSPVTVAASRKLVRAGVAMSLISARPPSGIGWIAEELGLGGPFGAFNGGTLFTRDGTVVERHGLEPDVARGVIEQVAKAGITCWVFADGLWYSNSAEDPYNPREVKAANVQPVITQDFTGLLGRVDKIVGVSPDDHCLTMLADAARDFAGTRATIARSQTYYLDVTAPQANKGDGISRIAAAFGVPLEDVAVIGDQANDLPMFARAGLSIAMGQATDEVKAHAGHVTAGSDEDGVARAIEALLNGDYDPRGAAASSRNAPG